MTGSLGRVRWRWLHRHRADCSAGPIWFAAVTVLMALFAAREWHRMVRSPAQRERRSDADRSSQTGGHRGCGCLRGGRAGAASRCRWPSAAGAGRGRRVRAGAPARRQSAAGMPAACSISACPSLALVALRVFPPQGCADRAGPVPDRLGHRHRRAGVRQSDRRPEARARACRRARPGPAPSAAASPRPLVVRPSISPFSAVDAWLGRAVRRCAFSVVAHVGDLFESLVKRRFGSRIPAA